MVRAQLTVNCSTRRRCEAKKRSLIEATISYSLNSMKHVHRVNKYSNPMWTKNLKIECYMVIVEIFWRQENQEQSVVRQEQPLLIKLELKRKKEKLCCHVSSSLSSSSTNYLTLWFWTSQPVLCYVFLITVAISAAKKLHLPCWLRTNIWYW